STTEGALDFSTGGIEGKTQPRISRVQADRSARGIVRPGRLRAGSSASADPAAYCVVGKACGASVDGLGDDPVTGITLVAQSGSRTGRAGQTPGYVIGVGVFAFWRNTSDNAARCVARQGGDLPNTIGLRGKAFCFVP